MGDLLLKRTCKGVVTRVCQHCTSNQIPVVNLSPVLRPVGGARQWARAYFDRETRKKASMRPDKIYVYRSFGSCALETVLGFVTFSS